MARMRKMRQNIKIQTMCAFYQYQSQEFCTFAILDIFLFGLGDLAYEYVTLCAHDGTFCTTDNHHGHELRPTESPRQCTVSRLWEQQAGASPSKTFAGKASCMTE